MNFRPCAVIPVYNHGASLAAVVDRLRRQELPCLVVDDGSALEHADRIRALGASDSGIEVLTHPVNRGKGAAVKTGLQAAGERGFSHVVQIDADGQHDLDDLKTFLARAQTYPEALICGRPVFDASIPKGRYYSRYLTHLWVWINTGSLAIPDAMCGFRVYPLTQVMPLLNREELGDRMDFDIEILVRLHWRGVAMTWLPTRVRYHADGVSHFRPLEDNWLISRMHARLFFGMLRRRLGMGYL
ncbi:MAG: glycosyltransferase family 2 protein [Methylohalobius sp. ZOD2]